MNNVFLHGRLGDDPKINNNKTAATLSLATDGYEGGEKTTDWHRVVMFGKQAEVADKHLKKGSEVIIQGRLKTRDYEKDGEKRYITEVIAHRMHFCGSKSKSNESSDDNVPW